MDGDIDDDDDDEDDDDEEVVEEGIVGQKDSFECEPV
jgi:hypothetical protein